MRLVPWAVAFGLAVPIFECHAQDKPAPAPAAAADQAAQSDPNTITTLQNEVANLRHDLDQARKDMATMNERIGKIVDGLRRSIAQYDADRSALIQKIEEGDQKTERDIEITRDRTIMVMRPNNLAGPAIAVNEHMRQKCNSFKHTTYRVIASAQAPNGFIRVYEFNCLSPFVY